MDPSAPPAYVGFYPPQFVSHVAPQPMAQSTYILPVVQPPSAAEDYKPEPITVGSATFFPEANPVLNRNFHDQTNNAILNFNEQIRKATIVVYDFSFLIMNILLIAFLIPVAFGVGILKSMTAVAVTTWELMLDSIYPYYELMYKIIRPPLILFRVILDTLSYIWPWRTAFKTPLQNV